MVIITNSRRIIEYMVELQLLSPSQTSPLFDPLVDIYQAVFSLPPYNETLADFFNFTGRLSYHAHQPGFRCVVALPAPGKPPVGFAYGYPGQSGTWFYDLVSPLLSMELKNLYLSDYFEFAELAVLPDWQRQGLGSRLHDTLLAGLSQRTACLATTDVETNARRLYRSRGWVTLLERLVLPDIELKFAILGKRLPPNP